MLLSLYIENIAVIRRLQLDLEAGFTAITGETGAGKSVILAGIKLLLGGRLDRELLRYGEESASVSAIFGNLGRPALQALADAEIEPDDDGCIQVQRTVTADGKSRCKINGQPVSLTVLRGISQYLIDIHGQRENLTLMDERSYTAILDGYAGNEAELSAYRDCYARLEAVRRRLSELDRGVAERLRFCEMLRFQIADIDAVGPKVGEDTALEEKELRIKNRERIVRQSSLVYRALKGAERGSVSDLLSRSAAALEPLSGLIPDVDRLCEELNDCRYKIEDVAERVYDIGDAEDGDPTALIDKIEARLEAYAKLKKKYGTTIEEIIRFRDEAQQRLEELDASDDTVAALRDEERALTDAAMAAGKRLHARRIQAAKELEQKITEILLYLDMPKVVFRISVPLLEGNALGRDGIDEVQLVMSANAGDVPRPLSSVASGGELARTFLALKCVLAERSLTPTMIFDEIDAGVSGKTARKIGFKLSELSRGTQVFCVTHSAQIASLADTHCLISKRERNQRTETELSVLDREGRIGELSRILGGTKITDVQRSAAADLLDNRTQ